MAQISVRLSEADTGIKGGISVGTGRYNQQSAVQVVADAVKRGGGSIGDAAIAALITQQNPGAPADVEESHEEFEEALSLGIDPRTFNSVSNTAELLKQARTGTRITSQVIQEIDAPTQNIQRTAALRDYNLMTNQDPTQKVYDLFKGEGRLFYIAKGATVGELTDKQLENLTKQQFSGTTNALFWAARKEQDRRLAGIDATDEGTSGRGQGGSGKYKQWNIGGALGVMGGTDISGNAMDVSMGEYDTLDVGWDKFLQRIEAKGDTITWQDLVSEIQTFLSTTLNAEGQPQDFNSPDQYSKVANQVLANYSVDTKSTFGIHLRGMLEEQGFGDPEFSQASQYEIFNLDPSSYTAATEEITNPLLNLPAAGDPDRAGAVWDMFNPLQQETFGQAYEREGAIQGGGTLAERYRAMMQPIAQLQYKLQPEAMGLFNQGASPREFLRSGQMLGGEDLTQRLTHLSDILKRSTEQPEEYQKSYGITPGTLEDPNLQLEQLTQSPEGMQYMQDMFLREGFKDPQMQALAGMLPAMMQSAPQTWGILSRGARNMANIALGTNPSANIMQMLGYGR